MSGGTMSSPRKEILMKSFYGKKVKCFCESCKDKMVALYNWKSGEVWAWALKVLLLSLSIVGLILLLKIMPYIAAVAFLIVLYLWDKAPFTNFINIPAPENRFAVREMIFTILRNNANVLDIQKPCTVDDITPTKYPAIQNINGSAFYRFIFYPNPNSASNFSDMATLINTKIMQTLQGGFPNIAAPFYNDFPSVYVLGIGEDANHSGYLNIDVLPVCDDGSFKYAQQHLQDSRSQKATANKVMSAPKDEDF